MSGYKKTGLKHEGTAPAVLRRHACDSFMIQTGLSVAGPVPSMDLPYALLQATLNILMKLEDHDPLPRSCAKIRVKGGDLLADQLRDQLTQLVSA